MTLGQIQRQARLEALIAGDVLIVLRIDPATKLPVVQLVNGDRIITPLKHKLAKGHRIDHGVELDSRGRHVAYYYEPIQPDNGPTLDTIRIPAHGAKSGRRTAWLVYGTPKLMNNVRGEPLLSVILQSLREIDRYKDAALRKAVVNSILAMFVERDRPGMSTVISSGAARKTTGTVETATGSKKFSVAEQIPGFVIEEMDPGQTIKPGPNASDINLGPFEAAMLSAIAWSMEMPPSILTLAFSSNYSASQAELNEFKMYLTALRWMIGQDELQPIYEEWLLSSVMTGKVQAQGLIRAWQDTTQYDIYQAWVSANWNGAIKPSTDMLKLANAYDKMISMGAITRHQASQELSGTNFNQNTKQLKRENTLLADAMRPILELKAEVDEQEVDEQEVDDSAAQALSDIEMRLNDIEEAG
jgi:capsid protein